MTGLLGYRTVNEAEGRTRVAVNGDAPGKTIEIVHAPDAGAAMNGLGTVHHVAMGIANGDEQLRMRAELVRYGLRVTEVRDRCYFMSIYFREPGGVLFEIATVPPGFLIDEPADQLGQALKLPPWEEPFRQDIERGLARVTHR
jgi:glyoxalase family protein